MSTAYERAIEAFKARERGMVRACGVGCCCSGAFVVGYAAGALGLVSAVEVAGFVLALAVPVAIATAAAVMVLVMLAACLQPVLTEPRRVPVKLVAAPGVVKRHTGRRLDVYG